MASDIAAIIQPLGAIVVIFAILLFAWDHTNGYLIYLFPLGLFLLGLSEVLNF